jgi:hypothetical protein
MKNIFILFTLILFFASCKTREFLTKGKISEYSITDETLIGTEVYITDPIRMVFDTTLIQPDNRKGFIEVKETHFVEKVKVRVQSKGVVETVDYIGKRLVLGVLFEKTAQPIYFIMNKGGFMELYLDKNNQVPYNDHNYELVSSSIPYLEVIIKKNSSLSKSKIIMTGY